MLYVFESYQLDLLRYELRHAGKTVKLEPQVFNLLAYLVQHRQRVVSKEELFEQLWPGRIVSEAALTSRLMAARKAVGDSGRQQGMIQTLHARGYRFIAEVEERTVEMHASTAAALPTDERVEMPASRPAPTRLTGSLPQATEQMPPGATASPVQAAVLPAAFRAAESARVVGREVELGQLHGALRQALQGARQIVFITGEAGMGKTTLVEAFLAEIETAGAVWIGRGQCLEHYGVGEAYLPVLEALGRLCKEPDGQALIAGLAQWAPTWLVQMPWLVHEVEFEAIQRRVLGATRERMLREMGEAIETLTAERPLVLVLEDLHWSDYATLDLVSLLARRHEPARFLLLGTYRPEAIGSGGHPLQGIIPTLQLRQNCQELSLSALSAAEVEAYLTARFMNDALVTSLAPVLHRRSEGNPLFMINLLEHWMGHGWLCEQDQQWSLRPGWEAIIQEIPATLRELVTQRQARLTPTEQRLLEAASVAGLESSAASIAAGLASDIVETETWCEELTRRGQFLQGCGVETWPDGTVATRYRLRHALYQDVIYERIPAARQAQLHQRIGAREEVGYGDKSGDIAARLAMHFDRGHDPVKAVQYHQQAAEQALQRLGYQEAITHLTHGLERLQTWPETPVRTERELNMQILLGSALITTRGSAAPEVERTYARARTLCQQLGETPQLLPTLRGLCRFYRNRGALATARELGEQLYRLTQTEAAAMHRLEAHEALGNTLFMLGDYAAARAHLEQGIVLTEPTAQRGLALRYGVAPGVTCLAYAANTLWCLGYPDQALQRSVESLALARALAHPHSLALAQHFAISLHHRRRDVPVVQEQAQVLLHLSTSEGFPLWKGFATCWQGWVLTMQGEAEAGLAQMRTGMAAVLATGQALSQSHCLVLLSEAAGHVGQSEEGLSLLSEALKAFEATGRGELLAETYRLQGEFLLRQSVPDAAQAEACLHRALALARRQQAKSWELRAAMSLCRLWQRQSQHDQARELLPSIYEWFTEGFDTADLQEAGRLLDEIP